jgi:streptomycin 6-kinase
MDGLAMPRNLVDAVELEGRQAWLATVPAIVDELGGLWTLEIGEAYQPGGQTAWVAPARDRSGSLLVLKIGWAHTEAVHEAEALRAWDGRSAVRLHAAKHLDGTIALLVERCEPGTALSRLPELEQDAVIATLLPRLWIEPPQGHSFRPLREMCEQWASEFERKTAHASVRLDPGLARQGIALFRQLATDDTRQILLATDLHAGNILAAQREPWLAIDPKPYVGDPTYDALQHMLNCDRRLHADPTGFTAHMAGLLDLDRERLRQWLFARCVQESPDWPTLADVARRVASH